MIAAMESPACAASPTLRSDAPRARFAAVLRAASGTIAECAASAPDAWIVVSAADSWTEPADELLAALPDAQRVEAREAIARLPASEVRVCVVGEPNADAQRWAWLAVYGVEADVPDHPAAQAWLAPAVPCPLPALQHAPGVDPFDAEHLAEWAIASADPQAQGSAALVLEMVSGLTYQAASYAAALLDGLDAHGHGLAYHMREVFDDETRTAVTVALALMDGLREWSEGMPVAAVAEPEPEPVRRTKRRVHARRVLPDQPPRGGLGGPI